MTFCHSSFTVCFKICLLTSLRLSKKVIFWNENTKIYFIPILKSIGRQWLEYGICFQIETEMLGMWFYCRCIVKSYVNCGYHLLEHTLNIIKEADEVAKSLKLVVCLIFDDIAILLLLFKTVWNVSYFSKHSGIKECVILIHVININDIP